MLQDFLEPFIAVGAAELGDKTQLAILLLSTRFKEKIKFLTGVMVGFLLVDGLAVVAGAWVGAIIPKNILALASGLLFILFGALMLRSEQEHHGSAASFGNGPLTQGFIMISIMEFGDKTQLAAGLFATKYNPPLVLAGALCALLILSASAVYLGDKVLKRIEKKTVTMVAAVAFILIGFAFILY